MKIMLDKICPDLNRFWFFFLTPGLFAITLTYVKLPMVFVVMKKKLEFVTLNQYYTSDLIILLQMLNT